MLKVLYFEWLQIFLIVLNYAILIRKFFAVMWFLFCIYSRAFLKKEKHQSIVFLFYEMFSSFFFFNNVGRLQKGWILSEL